MNLFQSIATPILNAGFRASLTKCDFCERSLALRNPAAKKAGIRMHGHWYCSSQCFTAAAEREFSDMLRMRLYRHDPTPRMPLALDMVRNGLLTDDQYRKFARKQKQTGREIGELLVEEGVVSEEQLTGVRAAQWGCPVFDVPDYPAPVDVHIPQPLIDAHRAVPLHYVRGTKTLLMGFVRAVEYGFLYAVETVTGCKTQACFVTPTGFEVRTEQRRQWLDSGEIARPIEINADHARTPGEMARTVCRTSVEFEADEAVMGKCKDYLWTRLKSSDREIDILFPAA